MNLNDKEQLRVFTYYFHVHIRIQQEILNFQIPENIKKMYHVLPQNNMIRET